MLVPRERDVDPLGPRVAEAVDRAVPDRHRRAADVDAVELGARDRDALESHAVGRVDLDSVLAADHRDVPDRHVIGEDDDATPHDCPRLAVEHLAASNHDRPSVDTGREVDGGRLRRPRGPQHEQERRRCERDERRAASAQLAAVLGIRQANQRQAGVAEHLREQPRADEEPDRGLEWRRDVEEADERHRGCELEQPEWHRRPARLIRQRTVVEADVKCKPGADHGSRELDRPPGVEGERCRTGREEWQQRRRKPRLQASSQRVRHASTRLRKRRAAYFIPTRVSAAG